MRALSATRLLGCDILLIALENGALFYGGPRFLEVDLRAVVIEALLVSNHRRFEVEATISFVHRGW